MLWLCSSIVLFIYYIVWVLDGFGIILTYRCFQIWYAASNTVILTSRILRFLRFQTSSWKFVGVEYLPCDYARPFIRFRRAATYVPVKQNHDSAKDGTLCYSPIPLQNVPRETAQGPTASHSLCFKNRNIIFLQKKQPFNFWCDESRCCPILLVDFSLRSKHWRSFWHSLLRRWTNKSWIWVGAV